MMCIPINLGKVKSIDVTVVVERDMCLSNSERTDAARVFTTPHVNRGVQVDVADPATISDV